MLSNPNGHSEEYRLCAHCGALVPSWRRRHIARWCPAYSKIWAGDVRVKIFAALTAYAYFFRRLVAQVRMITITAPGVEVGLVWDESVCAHRGPHRHSGPDGCRVLAAPAAFWNDQAPKSWRELHRVAGQKAKRAAGRAPLLLVRVVEKQARGVLHWHLIVGYTLPWERAGADAYVEALAELAPRYGFGFVDRKLEVKGPSQAAAYVSSYFVNGKGKKAALSETVRDGAMPRSIVYVAPWLSKISGITMRTLRLRRYAWAVWSRMVAQHPSLLAEFPDAREIWADLVRGLTFVQSVTAILER